MQTRRDRGRHIFEPVLRVPPYLKNSAGPIGGVSCEEEVQPAIVVIISPRHRTSADSRKAWRDHGRYIREPTAGVPPELGNCAFVSIIRRSSDEEVQPSVI